MPIRIIKRAQATSYLRGLLAWRRQAEEAYYEAQSNLAQTCVELIKLDKAICDTYAELQKQEESDGTKHLHRRSCETTDYTHDGR